MSRINVSKIRKHKGSRYPLPYATACMNRERKPLGDAAGLKDFGVNLMRLPPGAWSSQRHWHDLEDEFIYVVSGQVVLVTDAGETTLGPGDCAGFPKGRADGHHLINRSKADAFVLEVGSRHDADVATYSDIDMKSDPKRGGYVRKNGTAFPANKKKG